VTKIAVADLAANTALDCIEGKQGCAILRLCPNCGPRACSYCVSKLIAKRDAEWMKALSESHFDYIDGLHFEGCEGCAALSKLMGGD
jgi:hypothetical protein